jgi:hypothetical protein
MEQALGTGQRDAFLKRLDEAEDLAPTVGNARAPVPVTIAGTTYEGGIASVPIEELALCSAVDYEAMGPAHRSHRSRRLRQAAKTGALPVAYVEALQAKGVLPGDL